MDMHTGGAPCARCVHSPLVWRRLVPGSRVCRVPAQLQPALMPPGSGSGSEPTGNCARILAVPVRKSQTAPEAACVIIACCQRPSREGGHPFHPHCKIGNAAPFCQGKASPAFAPVCTHGETPGGSHTPACMQNPDQGTCASFLCARTVCVILILLMREGQQ